MAPGRKLPRELALPRVQPQLEQLEQLYAGRCVCVVGGGGEEKSGLRAGRTTSSPLNLFILPVVHCAGNKWLHNHLALAKHAHATAAAAIFQPAPLPACTRTQLASFLIGTHTICSPATMTRTHLHAHPIPPPCTRHP
jgi:hypothetical protein